MWLLFYWLLIVVNLGLGGFNLHLYITDGGWFYLSLAIIQFGLGLSFIISEAIRVEK